MYREIRVAIVEDDPYARDLMALLMWRDWRTRVVAEVGRPEDIRHVLEEENPNLILLGADDCVFRRNRPRVPGMSSTSRSEATLARTLYTQVVGMGKGESTLRRDSPRRLSR